MKMARVKKSVWRVFGCPDPSLNYNGIKKLNSKIINHQVSKKSKNIKELLKNESK